MRYSLWLPTWVHTLSAFRVIAVAVSITFLCGSMVVAGMGESTCPGDCNVDWRVDVDELVQGLGILLGRDLLDLCPPLDSDDDAEVHIDEFVTAIERSLNGCRRTATPTETPTVTATATPTAVAGPEIVFFGVTLADDSLLEPAEMQPGEPPVYHLLFGSRFSLVVEARADNPCSCSPLGCECVGSRTFDYPDAPDLQIQTTRPLGNGSAEVCDAGMENPGGVPAIDPPRFDDSPEVVEVLNDLGCRFIDGAGFPTGRGCSDQGCIRFETGEFGCHSPRAKMQFCGLVNVATEFPPGDTMVSARVRDVDGNSGAVARLIVRIGPLGMGVGDP
jgi:hypothetical protein